MTGETNKKHPFLAEGGLMGELNRSTNWAATELGASEHWPVALKHAASLMLSAPFPALICWGKKHILLYNEAFIPLTGRKDPPSRGISAKDAFSRSAWDAIGPMVDDANNGRAGNLSRVRITTYRDGQSEDLYFDFSFTPIRDEQGNIGGVLVISAECTEKFRAVEQLSINEQYRGNIVRQAPIGMCIIKGSPMMVEEINDHFLQFIGKQRKAFHATPYWEVITKSASHYSSITDRVLQTGETYYDREYKITRVRKGKEEIIYVDFIYQPIRENNGAISAVMIVAIEVTEKVLAKKASEEKAGEFQAINEELASANEEYEAINEELAAANEELAVVNEELAITVDELTETQKTLQRSEKLFKSIALNIPKSLIMVIDKDHRFIAVEGDIMEKMGYESRDYTGKHPADVSAPGRYEASKHLYDRVIGGEKFSVERQAESGESYMVHFVPLKDQAGEVEAGLIIALDITDIKLAEEKSAKLAAIVESSDDAIVSKTLESVITSWNASAERMFGYTADEIIGKTIYKIIPPDRQDEEPQILGRLKKGERVEHFETKRLTKDKRLIDVSLTISPVKNKQGEIIGLSKIARDITEKKLEEQRKNDFVAIVSHELKTPLTTISSYVQLLLAKAKRENESFRINALTRTDAQVRKMTAMIHDFLSIARLEEGKVPINKTVFEFNPLAEEIMGDIQPLTSKHTISLVTCQDVILNADRDKIGQVLNNLLSNAIKYSPDGGSITISCEKRAGKVTISVSDEGVGISDEDQSRLFERFYRASNDKLHTVSGFGIGLYLVSEVLRLHDSKIEVTSKENAGSTFYFTLNLAT